MSKAVEEVEKMIAQLPQDQLCEFRAWYEKFDAEVWDKQIEKDIDEGKFDAFAEMAFAELKARKFK